MAGPGTRVPGLGKIDESTKNMTDPIADMLTRVRNAVSARHTRVDMPASKLKTEIAKILQDEGYIAGFKLVDDKPARPGGAARPMIRLLLKYGPGGERVISGHPAREPARPPRLRRRRRACRPVLGGLGVSILTTSRGVMTGRSAAQGGRRRRSALQRVVAAGLGSGGRAGMARATRRPVR